MIDGCEKWRDEMLLAVKGMKGQINLHEAYILPVCGSTYLQHKLCHALKHLSVVGESQKVNAVRYLSRNINLV